jgi:hypothetical protein
VFAVKVKIYSVTLLIYRSGGAANVTSVISSCSVNRLVFILRVRVIVIYF